MAGMVRLLLALLLVFLSLSTPVSAACGIDTAGAQSCCCSAPPDHVTYFQLERMCCCAINPAPALAADSLIKTLAPQIALSVDSASLAPSVFVERARSVRLRQPFRLANNKIYLLKRSLLI